MSFINLSIVTAIRQYCLASAVEVVDLGPGRVGFKIYQAQFKYDIWQAMNYIKPDGVLVAGVMWYD